MYVCCPYIHIMRFTSRSLYTLFCIITVSPVPASKILWRLFRAVVWHNVELQTDISLSPCVNHFPCLYHPFLLPIHLLLLCNTIFLFIVITMWSALEKFRNSTITDMITDQLQFKTLLPPMKRHIAHVWLFVMDPYTDHELLPSLLFLFFPQLGLLTYSSWLKAVSAFSPSCIIAISVE